MALPLKRLSVLPNPWCALDKDGRPCGVCTVDPDLFGTRYIGANLDRDQTGPQSKAPQNPLTGRQYSKKAWFGENQISERLRTVFKFKTEPVSVEGTGLPGGLIMRKLRTRELLPADKATAEVAKVPWRAPADALAEEKAKAIALFDARMNHEGAYEALAAERAPVVGAEDERIKPSPESEPKSEKVDKPKADKPRADKKSAAPRAASKAGSK